MLPESALSDIAFLGITFYTSLLLSLLAAPLSSNLAVHLNILDHPDPRKVHAVAVPRLGGLAIAVSLILTTLICIEITAPVRAFLLGAAAIVITGLIDDKYSLSAGWKFIGQVLAALIFMKVGGLELQTLGNLLGTGHLELGFLAPAVTVFCMVGVMNAVNMSDGLDGLATGIGIIAGLFLAAVAYDHQAWEWSAIGLILLGVLFGFLRFNHYPAKMFMGDTGSLLIGYTLAAITVGLVQPEPISAAVPPVTMAIILGLPITDTLLVMTRRIIRRRNPFRPDMSHLHHRLLRMGIGHAGLVTIIHGIMLLMGFWAFLLRTLQEWQQFYLTGALFTVLYVLVWLMEKRRVDLSRLMDSIRIRPFIGLQFTGRMEKWFCNFPFLIFAMLAVPGLFISPVPRLLGLYALAAALFILLLYPWRAPKGKALISHGLVYAGSFSLLLIYVLAPDRPGWVLPFLYLCSMLAFLWVLLNVSKNRDDPILYPAAIEILLMLFSWFIPIVLIPILDLGVEVQQLMVLLCVQTVPLLCISKLAVRRHALWNKGLASGFIVFLLFLGAASFL
jgi:UDP-GlcNAc:undecaprenyl-phosphate/decaprenyl-phosphate GlcNAc-1-phosphate transferase